jgi:tetratricopeptide (TPR) repeat protein
MLLGRDLNGNSDFVGAEKHCREALQMSREMLGQRHRQVADCLGALARALEGDSKVAEAEKLQREALQMQRQLSGDRSGEVGRALLDLGGVLLTRGDFAGAAKCYSEALPMLRDFLGSRHPFVAVTLSNMGGVFYHMGDLNGAEKYCREALQMERDLRGEGHPNVLIGLNNLGVFLEAKGDLDEAEKCCREELQLSRQYLGEHHKKVAVVTCRLGEFLHRKGDLEGAEKSYRDALQMLRTHSGSYEVLGRVLVNLSGLLAYKGDLEGALNTTREGLQLCRERPEREAVVITDMNVHNMGEFLSKKGDFEDAEKYYREAVQRRRERFAQKHPEVALMLHELGGFFEEKGDLAGAEQYYREALQMRRELLGSQHPDVMESVRALAWVLQAKGDESGAERLYREELPWPVGPATRDKPNLNASLAAFLQAKGDLAGAEATYREWVRVQSGKDEHSTRTLDAKELLAMVRVQREPARATEILQDLGLELRTSLEFRQAHVRAPTTQPSGEPTDQSDIAWIKDHVEACDNALVESQEARGPFGKAPATIPGLVQAEDFDRGGFGVSYWDTTLLNLGTNKNRYRCTSVDLHDCIDLGGGLEVGWIRAGEWLAYTVEVLEDGDYDLALRIGTPGIGARTHVEFDGRNATGPIMLPRTGSFQVWQTATTPRVRLRKGRQVMRIVFDAPARGTAGYVCELNWIRLSKSGG